MILQAMLGIQADAQAKTLYINAPVLPMWLTEVDISELKVGDSTISLKFNRVGDVTSFMVTEKSGDIRTVVTE
jgi:hypothetical protein